MTIRHRRCLRSNPTWQESLRLTQMVACSLSRKWPARGARLDCWLGRPSQGAAFGLDRVEQRPVAVREHVAFGERRAQLQPERAQHAIVAVVALQHDADEGCSRRTA